MDGDQGPDEASAAAGTVTITDVARALAAVRPARDSAGLIGQLRELEDLKSAAAASQARLAVTFRNAGDPRTRGQLMADTIVERTTGTPGWNARPRPGPRHTIEIQTPRPQLPPHRTSTAGHPAHRPAAARHSRRCHIHRPSPPQTPTPHRNPETRTTGGASGRMS